MSNKVSVHFYLHPTVLNNGNQRVRGRITVRRLKSEFATDYSAKPADWNEKEGSFKKNYSANEELQKLKGKIYELKSFLALEGKEITAKRLRDLLLERSQLRFSLLEYFAKFIQDKKRSGELSQQRIRHYTVTESYLKDFIQNELKQADYPLKEVDYSFIEQWDSYLRNINTTQYGEKMAISTLNSHHTRIKTIVNRAFKEGLIPKSPYLDFKLKKEVSLPKYLTSEELKQIEEHDLGGNVSLQGVRAVFLFSCYTGLRFGDAQNLKMKDIRKAEDGTYSIEITQMKTDNDVYVPLLKKALKIVEAYGDSDERILNGSVLPQISNVKTNAYLKVIQDVVGIRTKLTHNVARHTFATTVLLDAGVPLEVTSKLMGHSKISTTQVYGKITKNNINSHVEKIERL